MSFYIGTDSVKGVYVGTDEVQKIYLGTDLVYSRGRRKTLLFSDTGVTGTANPNYTIIVVCGGPRITHELAKELGFDAGFGMNTYADDVASFICQEYVKRHNK